MSRRRIPFPFSYLITDGTVSAATYAQDSDRLVDLVRRLCAEGLSAVQIREKSLPSDLLFDLSARIARGTREAGSLCLVNERFDIAVAAEADGVHLTSRSIPIESVRRKTPEGFLIFASTHSPGEAAAAASAGADLAVFGPVFRSPGKGEPTGTGRLTEAVNAAAEMPVVALGGLSVDNLSQTIVAGAHGIAGITMFRDPVSAIRVLRAMSDLRKSTKRDETRRPK